MKHLVCPELIKSGSYINGSWQQQDRLFEVVNPANQQLLAQLATASADDAKQAVEAAAAAFASWSALPAAKRADILQRWYQLIMQHQDDLARLLT